MNIKVHTVRMPAFLTFCAIAWFCTITAPGQSSVAEFNQVLRDQAGFDSNDLASLQQGQTVVKLLPAQDKREVAVSGVVGVPASSEVFLQSFRESMYRKSNPAVLEIGGFSSQPVLEDLNGLTFEEHDIEDLKTCVVGECRLKLSAAMIGRLRKEVDWEAPDYSNQATHLLKVMLLEYVRDYMARGDLALIEYHDKAKKVRMAEEQQALATSSGYLSRLPELRQHLRAFPESGTSPVENRIVWSKIKFGLKPVFAINHIMIFQTKERTGPQVVVVSKQIYANHYFDSSLAVTAFVNLPGTGGSFLLYENRSRADGLEGMFSKLKRGLVEDRAVDGLKSILERTSANLNARVLSTSESEAPAKRGLSWGRWAISGSRLFWWLLLFTAFVALLARSSYHWKTPVNRGAHD